MKTHAVIIAALALLPAGAGAQSGGSVADSVSPIAAITLPSPSDTAHRPADFVDVDKEPELITKVEPVYPADALKSHMEGKVWVKIWVDTEGKAREVVLMKSDAEIFNASAIAAARQFRFNPAMIKGKPVDVWVAVPFKFRIAEKPEPSGQKPDTVHEVIPRIIREFVRDVLAGPVPDTARVRAMLTENAQAVTWGYLKSLRQAIAEQRGGYASIEQPGRAVAFFTYGMAASGKCGYLTVRTEKVKGDEESGGTTAHYHTVVIEQSQEGSWKIMCWQSWQGGRTP